MDISKLIEIKMPLTPKDAAIIFCSMNAEEQAKFFNEVFEESNKWDAPFEFQMASIKGLTEGGRKIMRTIGDYYDNP